MIDISFEINGRKVRPNQAANALEKAILKDLSDSISKSLRSVRCSEHGERPKVKFKGRKLDRMKIEISGCCDDLVQRATKKIS